MNTFGKEAEDKLLRYAKLAQAYVSEHGMVPTDAIVKVAKDESISLDMLPLVVQAYNVGRQGFQREKCDGKGILCKVAEFPIARLEDVVAKVFPSQPVTKAARANTTDISADWLSPPGSSLLAFRDRRNSSFLTKAASVKLAKPPDVERGDPDGRVFRAVSLQKKAVREVEEARRLSKVARDRLLASLGKVAAYFRQMSHDRLPLAEVEFNSKYLFGPPAESCIDYAVASYGLKEARANGRPPAVTHSVDVAQPPYSLIKTAIGAASTLLEKDAAYRRLSRDNTEKVAEAFRPFDLAPPPNRTSVLDQAAQPECSGQAGKAASFLGGVMGGMGVGLTRNLTAGGGPQSTEQLQGGLEGQMTDPQFLDDLTGIEAKAVFNDLLANDDVVSGFDSDEVISAYNEIVRLNPSAATQPALLRPLLRKRLSVGSLEPFEAQQMADIEKSLQQTSGMGGGGQGNVTIKGMLGDSPVLG